jgi:hypothetical protein
MIIYNVTVNVENDIHDEWLHWMKTVHIPEVMETACFTHHYFCRIVSRQPDETGHTYAIQYHCKSQEAFDTYQRDFASDLQAKHIGKYEGKFVAFRTLLEKVE